MTTVSYDASLTEAEYGGFQRAYDHFNGKLFGGSLPAVLITLQRHANARGYFLAHSFTQRGGTLAQVLMGENSAHELALNPDTFQGRTDEEILSTLAHEMAHVWQQCHGKPPRRCYHDKQWSSKMKAIGLQPTATGEPGGKETGQRVTHCIISGGPFQRAYEELQASGFRLSWQAMPDLTAATKKAASKTKYTCPSCGTNAWAKPETNLICADCFGDDDNVLMEPEDPA